MKHTQAARHWAVQWLDEAQQAGWAGWDPYDGLNCPGAPWLTFGHKWLRIVLIQFFKRSPINFRPFLGMPQQVNPKALALFAEAAMDVSNQDPRFKAMARQLLDLLVQKQRRWQKGSAWGYPFNWQSRAFYAPAGTPNVVVTSFAGEALWRAFEQFQEPAYRDAAFEAARFVAEDLHQTPTADGLCFSYTPLDHSRIDNANLLAAAFLMRTGKQAGETRWVDLALKASRHAIRRQQANGAWTYGEATNQGWIDHFHTGFNLDALDRISQMENTGEFQDSLARGFNFYLNHFFESDGAPRYYAHQKWPIDVHSAVQALITLSRFQNRFPEAGEQLEKTTLWTLTHLVEKSSGRITFQQHPFWKNRILYRRWSQAWLCRALTAYLTCERNSITAPLTH